ncbi:putative endolysin [Pseudoalteromonas phage RIO-1]|uniref:Putative endolysin n=1 Tax=Pseudoalteromonas phage RIO-1 TaxID=1316739 RepID=R4JE22_9CAUD|nr:putative endolysin [Pseudoalteromonas phage RIO-1]AGK87047.1 putative endolysin [Pseudoalteromonas phage RIO-1]
MQIKYDYQELKSFIHELLDKISIASNRPGIYKSHVAEVLLMIAAHESKGTEYREQLGGGPAKGIFQIEPETHDSIWDNSDIIHEVAKSCGIRRNVDLLENDDVYSVFMARMYIAMDSNPCPKPPSYKNMAKYCKEYWNRTGKATWEKYNDDYMAYKRGDI